MGLIKVELPKVFENKIDKKIDNVQEVFRSDRIVFNKDINSKINYILNSKKHVYKTHVKITTISNILDEFIVGRSRDSILTMNGKYINISDIKDIEVI